jgi:hypothetical protein
MEFCWLWESNCNFVIDSGWVQAFGSIAAIIVAFYISNRQHESAMEQVRMQHENDLVLRSSEIKARQQAIAATIIERISNAASLINIIVADIDDHVKNQTSFTDTRRIKLRESLKDVHSDLTSMSIFDLPSAHLVKDHAVVRTELQQVIYSFDEATAPKSFFDTDRQNTFQPVAEQALRLLYEYRVNMTIYAE